MPPEHIAAENLNESRDFPYAICSGMQFLSITSCFDVMPVYFRPYLVYYTQLENTVKTSVMIAVILIIGLLLDGVGMLFEKNK
jgi:hypothetical protein